MAKKNLVTPQTLKGCQDLLPEALIPRKDVVRRIEDVFARYGFAPLETPALEYLDTLLGTGGEETNKELFRLDSPEGDPIALRFDHTVPFARLMAQYPDKLKPPFRRYAAGPVWRADKPGPGRFRQFTQMDADIAGPDTVAVDAELAALACDVMAAAGAEDYAVLINNRKLIDALLESCGIDDVDKQKHVLRIIDKLSKVGIENVRLELAGGRIDDSGDPIPGAHLDDAAIARVEAFVGVRAPNRGDTVTALEQALPESEASAKALDEMRELAACLDALGVSEAHARFAPSLARGLDYYTGPVFEVVLPQAPEFGSVGGGGRYNQLVARFLNRPVACTGFSVGLDRLMAALAHLEAAPRAATTTQALVVTMGKVPKAETLRIAAELRAAGIRTDCYFASRKKMAMSNQLSHADLYDIPVAVIIGEDELAQGQASIKDLRKGKQERAHIEDRDAYREAGKAGQTTVSRADMIATVRGLLGA